MTIPTAGGPWTALLLIGAYATVALAFVPSAVTTWTRHRRANRAIRYWHQRRDRPLTDREAARLDRMLRP